MAAGLARDPETGGLVKLIGTSDPNGYLRAGVTLEPDEVLASGLGHAEQDIAAYAQANGLELIEVAATRPMCAMCVTVTFQAGGVPLGPLKIGP
jgi:filamentous hemagglutinin